MRRVKAAARQAAARRGNGAGKLSHSEEVPRAILRARRAAQLERISGELPGRHGFSRLQEQPLPPVGDDVRRCVDYAGTFTSACHCTASNWLTSLRKRCPPWSMKTWQAKRYQRPSSTRMPS